MSLLKFPPTGFQQIEEILTKNPKLLDAGDWHTLPYGTEALTPEQIMQPYTRHCLAGWIVFITPKAAEYERLTLDVDDFANEILVNSGRQPIPQALFFSDEESMLKCIRYRAAQERAATAASQQLSVN